MWWVAVTDEVNVRKRLQAQRRNGSAEKDQESRPTPWGEIQAAVNDEGEEGRKFSGRRASARFNCPREGAAAQSSIWGKGRAPSCMSPSPSPPCRNWRGELQQEGAERLTERNLDQSIQFLVEQGQSTLFLLRVMCRMQKTSNLPFMTSFTRVLLP